MSGLGPKRPPEGKKQVAASKPKPVQTVSIKPKGRKG